MLGLRWIGASSKQWLPPSVSLALLFQSGSVPLEAPLHMHPMQTECSAENPDAMLWYPRSAHSDVVRLLADWQRHPLFPLFDCFQLRSYQTSTELQCQTEGARQRLRCQPALLPRELMQRHIILAPTATASADAHQMVLPMYAEVDLLAHEVGHWLGFADEYPMSTALAESYCRGAYQHASLNVVVTTEYELTTDALVELWRRLPWRFAVADWRQLGTQQENGLWRLGSGADDAVGLFSSDTCAKVSGKYAWKPVAEWTAMQYHDVKYWPELYLNLARAYSASLNSGLRDHDNRAE